MYLLGSLLRMHVCTSRPYTRTHIHKNANTKYAHMHTHVQACKPTCIMHTYKKAVTTTYFAAMNIHAVHVFLGLPKYTF